MAFFSDLQVLQCVQYPLKIVRGTGAYLYDEYGVKYLDATNNVACGKLAKCLVSLL